MINPQYGCIGQRSHAQVLSSENSSNGAEEEDGDHTNSINRHYFSTLTDHP